MYTISDNKKTLYVGCIYDVEPNEGGLYCEVYDNEAMDDSIDDFCISKESLEEYSESGLVKEYIIHNHNMSKDAKITDGLDNIAPENAEDALRKLDLDELQQVFGSLMNTDHIFWDLLGYVIENDETSAIAYEYMIDKLLNDCHEKEILEEVNLYY